ncbi:Breast cancer metastasis-suppressor 1-like protein [Takifugu flavidus]|uniref:Breast cancer metastasis-suppressor 1-like protein n=1 Tax=Takifugu flavidus TaxID=433684 RepID=A0A5C6NPH0_9TELE|nr:Breast cancer metastasis-suppressor 1-like protein [Takifugu flavidus]
MPVHSREKKESNHDEMEVDFPEQDGSSTDEEDTVSSSVSEDGDSSEMDDEDCERRRMECLDEMTNLEKQFTDLKEQLYKERLSQVDIKLQEVMAGCAQEYLEPLANLQENMQIRTKVAGIYRGLCLESVKNKYECEIQAACQHWESEKLLLFDTVQSELEEKIRRLEEDRHSIDITSGQSSVFFQSCGMMDYTHGKTRRKIRSVPSRRRSPWWCLISFPLSSLLVSLLSSSVCFHRVAVSCTLTTPSRPYIVYMLQDLDILEDWTAIRKAVASLGPHRVKVDAPAVKPDRHHHVVRSEDGRLFYDNQWYCRGQAICINKKDDYPTSAIITNVNSDEVWFKRLDGSKSKLYVSQLQKGKYTIKHS